MSVKSALWILLLGALAFVARCHNLPETFIRGQFYFVDGDCYSRMTRARLVLENPGLVIHHHDFENFPEGVRSHTTAPFDYAIALFKLGLDLPLRLFAHGRVGALLASQSLDLAGALISPLCGALTCLSLGWWTRWGISGLRLKLCVAPPLFFAVSPILVHGTLLGRPDHQAPIILLLAIALTAELSLLSTDSPEGDVPPA